MNEIAKMCRFCLQEEKDGVSLIHIFSYKYENVYEQIKICLGLILQPHDIIPPLICKNCLTIIETYFVFIERVKKSEKILLNLYFPNKHKITKQSEHINEEIIKSSPKNEKDVANIDNVISCDSDSNLKDEEKEINTKWVDSPMPGDQNEEPALYFPRTKTLDLFNVNETVENINQSNNYPCGICFKNFNSFFEYQDHQSTHNGQPVFYCSRCEQVFSIRQELLEHENNHKIPCDLCSVAVLPKSLLAHKKKHTDQYKCLQCNKRHTSKASLDRHYKAQHMGMKGNVCHICGKQNSCQSSMNRHIASHNSDRPFKCTFCNFTSKSRAVLQVHMQRKHVNQKCVCEMCAKIFKSELSLRQHMKRFHTLKNHACIMCNKMFSEKFNLDKHVLKKHTKQRLYECKICKRESLTVRELKAHMHTHRQGCESCSHCGKIFFYKKNLEKHSQKCVDNPKNGFDIKTSPNKL